MFKFLLLALALAWQTYANPHNHALSVRAHGDIQLHKRQTFTNAKLSFYDAGLGACGGTNSDSDPIVALNTEQFQASGSSYPAPVCGKSITISYGGKTHTATIVDECLICPYGGLDLARHFFDFFASENTGIVYGEWWYNDGSSDPTSTTTKHTMTHTSTSTHHTTSSTTTSTTTSHTSSHTTSSTSTSSTTTSSSASSATATIISDESGGIDAMYQAFIDLSALVAAAGDS